MASATFKGTITTTGRSEALRLDKALFKAHPEFRQKARIRAHVIGPGSLLVTLDAEERNGAEAPDAVERDPVVSAYLAFLERDLREHPDRLQPFTEGELARLEALTKDVEVSDDEAIPDDVTL
ncbi:MAG: type II toxin-antitoxin system PrlF family antitoxin [Roseiarcus sp.]